MLQGRLFAYGDAHSYRVGSNAGHLPVNRPHATEARTNSGDGFLTAGTGNHEAPAHSEDDDFVQAGNLYRLMSEDEKERLIANLAGAVAPVSREDIAERAIDNFRQADDDFGKRLEAAVQALRG
jgi:catalase